MSRYVVCKIEEGKDPFITAYGETLEEAISKAEECGLRTGKRYIVIDEEKLNQMLKLRDL